MIHELSLGELENAYIKAIKEAEEAGKDWVNAKAEFESWYDKRRPELARLMGQCEGSQAAREQFAYSHKEWTEFLSQVGGYRRDYLLSLVNYDMAKLKIEALRTIISTRRQEIASFKG